MAGQGEFIFAWGLIIIGAGCALAPDLIQKYYAIPLFRRMTAQYGRRDFEGPAKPGKLRPIGFVSLALGLGIGALGLFNRLGG